MIIQSANPASASVLPGTESSSSAQQALPLAADSPQSFTASILQQLGLLQNNLPNNAAVGTALLADLQLKLPAAASDVGGKNMQEFAALLGNVSPSAKDSSASINLDDTLHTLADVLQYLQSLTTDPASGNVTPVLASDTGQASVAGNADQNNTLLNVSQTAQAVDPAVLAAAAEALNQQIQQAQQKSDSAALPISLSASLTVSPATKSSQSVKQANSEQDQNALAVAISAAMLQAQIQPQPPIQQQQQAADNELAGNTSITTMTMSGSDATAMSNSLSQLSNAEHKTLQTNQDQQHSSVSNIGSQNEAAQFNLGGAAQSSDQQSFGDADKNADNLSALLAPSSSKDSEKSPTGMANDIAQLNQAVSTSKAVDLPPMTRNLSHPNWDQELSDKLVWMHKQDVPSAELRLNPEHLGPISIKIDVSQDQATVSFTAQHAEVKDAIEAAIPKLREMLGNQQLTLVDVNVSQQQSEQNKSPYQSGGQAGNGNKSGQNGNSGNSTSPTAVDTVNEIDSGRAIASNGLLSLFA
jgi:flagellar hook-length control protein FliK